MLAQGAESSSNAIHRIHWRLTDSNGKVHDLFVRVLQKVHLCWMRGLKVVPMGSIRHEQMSMEICIFLS